MRNIKKDLQSHAIQGSGLKRAIYPQMRGTSFVCSSLTVATDACCNPDWQAVSQSTHAEVILILLQSLQTYASSTADVVEGCLPVQVQAEQEQQEPIEDCIVRRRVDVVHISNQLQCHKEQ